MATPTPSRTQAERADQTRSRILDAAIRQFGANGLAGARTEQIAEAAGVNKALLYYYFNSKEALYTAALESVVERVQAESRAVLEGSASAGERFLRIVLSNFDRTHSNPPYQSLFQQEMIRLNRGETNALALLAEKIIAPLWLRVREVVECRSRIWRTDLCRMDADALCRAGSQHLLLSFCSADRSCAWIRATGQGSACVRRKAAIEYLGQAIFVDREHGARVAALVLDSTPMPEPSAKTAANLLPMQYKPT